MDAFGAGWEAYSDGYGMMDNPYSGEPLGRWWRAGFRAAAMEEICDE